MTLHCLRQVMYNTQVEAILPRSPLLTFGIRLCDGSFLTGGHTVVLTDNDAASREHMRSCIASSAYSRATIALYRWPRVAKSFSIVATTARQPRPRLSLPRPIYCRQSSVQAVNMNGPGQLVQLEDVVQVRQQMSKSNHSSRPMSHVSWGRIRLS